MNAMSHIKLSMARLPNQDGVAVIGGTEVTPVAVEMAKLVGQAIIEAGRILVTGGGRGAGESAAIGAAAMCRELGLDLAQRVFSVVPVGDKVDYQLGAILHAGADQTERRILVFRNTVGAIVIGGGSGTADEILICVLQAIMDGYAVIPASGTGGVADRICRTIPRFSEDILNNPSPSYGKAKLLVEKVLCSPCWYCDIDPSSVHDLWFFGGTPRDLTAMRMAELRRRYY